MQPLLPWIVLVLTASAPIRAGVIEGRVFGPGGQPVVDLDIDIFNQVTGMKLKTPNDDTSVSGRFAVSVPPGLYRVGLDTFGLPGPTLAPAQVLDVLVTTTTDIGDVHLQFGAMVSGTVVGPDGPLAGADIDLHDVSTGAKVYTPHDDTDASGNFAFAVALGTYDVEIEPPVASSLLAFEAGTFGIAGDTSLGTLIVSTGVTLRGLVTGPGGGPVPGIDLDAFETSTGFEISLADDPSGPDGAYAVVVPQGTFDVLFAPHPNQPFLAQTAPGVVVSGETQLDAQLALAGSDPSPTPLGLRNTFTGILDAPMQIDEATVDALAGMLLTLKLKFDEAPALMGVALRAPSGATMPLAAFRKEKKKRVTVKSVVLPETGEYTLLLYSRVGGTSSYALAIKGKIPSDVRKISLLDTITTPGQQIDIPFLALPGSLLDATVKIKGGSALDPRIVEVRDPTGTPLTLPAFLKTVPGKSESLKKLPLDMLGTYTLTLGGAGGTVGDVSTLIKVKPPKLAKGPISEN